MPVMKQLRIGSETYDTVGEASVTQVLTSGTKIATVTIDGTATDLYAPEGGSSIDPATTAPSMDGTAATGTSTDYARADHVHPTDTSRAAASHTHAIADVTGLQTTLDGKSDTSHTHSGYQPTLVSGTNIKTVNGTSLLGSGDITTPTYATQAVRIPASAWSGTTATVSASAATATNDVIVAPAPESVSAWASAGIYCSAQGSGTLTFACTTAPTVAVTANVMAFEGGETIAPSTYSVTVSLTNPSYGQYFRKCNICGYDTTAEETTVLLGEIDSPTGSATVEYDLSLHEKLSIDFDTNWGASYNTSDITCTGGVSYYGITAQNEEIFNVEGDGTITIDGVDYDD